MRPLAAFADEPELVDTSDDLPLHGKLVAGFEAGWVGEDEVGDDFEAVFVALGVGAEAENAVFEAGLDVPVDDSADIEVPASAVVVEAARTGPVDGVALGGKVVAEEACDHERAVESVIGVEDGAAIQD